MSIVRCGMFASEKERDGPSWGPPDGSQVADSERPHHNNNNNLRLAANTIRNKNFGISSPGQPARVIQLEEITQQAPAIQEGGRLTKQLE